MIGIFNYGSKCVISVVKGTKARFKFLQNRRFRTRLTVLGATYPRAPPPPPAINVDGSERLIAARGRASLAHASAAPSTTLQHWTGGGGGSKRTRVYSGIFEKCAQNVQKRRGGIGGMNPIYPNILKNIPKPEKNKSTLRALENLYKPELKIPII